MASNEFIQGFATEAAEHLQAINQNLLRLEQAIPSGAGGEDFIELAGELDELFRSFHTLKGLAGMVGLPEAARLSHVMETVLQEIRARRLAVSPPVIDRLLDGTRALGAIVRAVKSADPAIPTVDEQIQAIEVLLGLPEQAPSPAGGAQPAVGTAEALAVVEILPDLAIYPDLAKSLKEVEVHKILTAARARHRFALVLFEPSREKSERGENVDSLRHQIEQVGTLVKAVPIFAGDQVRFALLVASPQSWDPGSIPADEVIPLTVRIPTVPERQQSLAEAVGAAAGEVVPLTFVRVDLRRLDEMLQVAGDLVMLRARLGQNLARLDGAPAPLRRDLQQLDQQLGRSLRDLRRTILRARMVPLAESFDQMPLVVRDLARASGKDVRLVIEGEETEVDKALVERLLDPLMHLVRNAITHGIEPPDERVDLGKPPQGTLRLCGIPEGDHILITVTDDGRGIDLERVTEKAVRMGWLDRGKAVTSDELLEMIVRPGFSTRDEADLSAGRGVGLDVVQKAVRSIGGQLTVETRPQQGTTFTLRLPFTLVILDVFIVQIGAERYAVPQNMVREIIEIDPGQIMKIESGELLPFRGGNPLALRRLSDLVRLPADGRSTATLDRYYGLVGTGEEPSVLVVDGVLNLREIVVHAVNDPLIAQPGISGATELGDGRVILILDIPALFRRARQVE